MLHYAHANAAGVTIKDDDGISFIPFNQQSGRLAGNGKTYPSPKTPPPPKPATSNQQPSTRFSIPVLPAAFVLPL